MKVEEQLQMAYMKIAELTEIISRLEKRVDPAREEKLRKMYEDERERTEAFYLRMMEQMRMQHALDMERLEKNLKAAYEVQMKGLRDMLAVAQSSQKISASRESLARAKMFGRKSEKTSRLGRKDKDDRGRDKNDFDGTSCGSSPCGGTPAGTSSADKPSEAEDLIKKLQRNCKKMYPGAKIEIRTDYSKQKDYTDNAIYHKLGEYFTLGEGEYFVTRDGDIDISLIKVVIRYPETIEEHIYETATVRSSAADDYRTISVLDLDRPVEGCCFGSEMLAWIISEKYCYNTPFDQIVTKLKHQGFNMSKSTLGDNIHRVLAWLRSKMSDAWTSVIRTAKYWMMDETVVLVGCKDKDTDERAYLRKYMWTIRANLMKLVWFVYESGGRGAKAIEGYLKDFIGIYTTDGYVVYKVFDAPDDDKDKSRRRSSCAVHQRRYFIEALEENSSAAMWFINEYNKLFAIEHNCKSVGMTSEQRLQERLKPGSTRDILVGMEARLQSYEETGYAECGTLVTKALKYMRSEWEAMQTVLVNGDVEISNNLAEQMMRHVKMNLKTASNIGSEESALDNAFMFSVIESCKLNKLSPEKYIRFLLGKIKGCTTQHDYKALLPCYCNI